MAQQKLVMRGAEMVWVVDNGQPDYEHNSQHSAPTTPAGQDGLSQWSGQRMGVPNRDLRAEIAALEAQLAAGRLPSYTPPRCVSNIVVDPNVEPYEYMIQRECSADRRTAGGW